MSTFRTSNESKDAVFASLRTLREYAKTGVVTQEFKLFIEGVEVPYLAMSISESYKGLPSATVQIPYFAGLNEITKNYAPKVHIFFKDYVYERYLNAKGVSNIPDKDLYRTLFEGILLTHSYNRTKAAESGSATIQFSCVHKYSLLAQILLKFGGRGPETGIENQAESTAVSAYMNSASAIIEMLSGIDPNAQSPVTSTINNSSTVSVRALQEDLKKYANRLLGVPGITLVLWNTMKRDAYSFSEYARSMIDMYIPMVDSGLRFFKRMTGHPVVEVGLEQERLSVSVSKLAEKKGFDKISNQADPKILVPPNYRNFINEAVAVEVAFSLAQNGLNYAGESASLTSMYQGILENMLYDMQVIASPIQAKKQEDENIDVLVKPLLPFYYAPTCNVLLPHLYSSISINDACNLSPTRLISFGDIFAGLNNQGSKEQEYRSPHDVRLVTALNNPEGNFTLTGSTIRTGEYPVSHEYSRGILVKNVPLKPWIKHLMSSYQSTVEEENGKATNYPIRADTTPPAATASAINLSQGVARVIDVTKSPLETRPVAIWKYWDKTYPIPYYFGSIKKKGLNIVYGKQGTATIGSTEDTKLNLFRSTTSVPEFWNVVYFPYNDAVYAFPPHFDYIRKQWFAVKEIPVEGQRKYTYIGESSDNTQRVKVAGKLPVPPTTTLLSQPTSIIGQLISTPTSILASVKAESSVPSGSTTVATSQKTSQGTPEWVDSMLQKLRKAWDLDNPGQESLNPFAPSEVNGAQPHEITLINTLDYEYALSLVESRQGSIEGMFNPYAVVGYPMDIIDPSPERPSYHAFCISKTHSITPRSCSTSFTVSSALTYDELRGYELPALLPWFRKQLGFVDKLSLINQSSTALAYANSFYRDVFGCGMADPTILENAETNSLNFVKVNSAGDFEVTKLKANLQKESAAQSSILGFVDQNMSYEGNLALVRREIETLTDIEKHSGIKFVMIPSSSDSELKEIIKDTSRIKVSALYPAKIIKPGRSVFLDYSRLDADLAQKVKNRLKTK